MNTPKDDLFQLIHSLDKQEKRYFKIHACRHVIGAQNNYVKLFDAIDSLEEYDEKALKQLFKNEGFTKQFHVAKNYLNQMILQSLRHYNEHKPEERFGILLRNAQILFQKGLYDQCENALAVAEKQAQETENFLHLLEVQRWRHRIIHLRSNHRELESYLKTGLTKELELVLKYENFLHFQSLNDRIHHYYWKNGSIRNESEIRELKAIFATEPFCDPHNAQSFISSYYYYQAAFSLSFISGDTEGCHRQSQRLIQLFKNKPLKQLKGQLMRYYISALYNGYSIQRKMRKFEELPETLELLRTVLSASPDHHKRFIRFRLNMEIDYFVSTGKFSDGLAMIPEIEANIEMYKKEIDNDNLAALYYNLSYLCFGAGQYSRSLDWMNVLLNSTELQTREDIQCFARILNLIIHYELGNDELLEYIAKSTYRYLSNRKRLYRVEAVMLKFMRHYPKWTDSRATQKGLQSFIADLIKLKEDDYEKQAFEYFDFISWMESKSKKQSFELLVQEKVEA